MPEAEVCEVIVVGGSDDGRRVTLPAPPPPILRLPVDQPLSTFREMTPRLEIADYVPIFDEFGRASRADDGAWRYELRSD